MACNHSHHGRPQSDGKIGWAVAINILLTVAQFIGGLLAGSLALIADAIHNFSDAGALLLALIARKIARRAPDDKRSYGYKKVETLAAFTNFLVLVLIALWLAIEAVMRFFEPVPVIGQTMLMLAGFALIVDIATALLVRKEAKTNQNMRAAYLHNIADAISSVGVMIAGFCIMQFGWTWIDPLITFGISGYIILHAMHDFPSIINILIDGKSSVLSSEDIAKKLMQIEGVKDVHHMHIRQLGEGANALEAHVVLAESADMDMVKLRLKECLKLSGVFHSTIEFEKQPCAISDCRH